MNTSYVYILSSCRNGTIYIGVTNHLMRRVFEHKAKMVRGFTAQYGVDKLVYYEEHQEISTAIQREKRLKEWPRKWKIALIEKHNPYWNDLFDQLSP
ncbi:MAG TPA: GIY-YIG nuclease family protein [Gammaproteobacteria bacterium]|nr:GIY-YIG nuclease family protein [Gammaproteobacteria bacterium]